MKSAPEGEDRRSIKIKQCPFCNATIQGVNCLKTYNANALKDIKRVKIKVNNSYDDRLEIVRQLRNEIAKKRHFGDDTLQLQAILNDMSNELSAKSRLPSMQKLVELKNKIKIMDKLREIYLQFTGKIGNNEIMKLCK